MVYALDMHIIVNYKYAEEEHMRSTVVLNEKLIENAKKLTGLKTKKDVIDLSLKELIKKKRINHLLSLYGTAPIDISLEDVEGFRRDE